MAAVSLTSTLESCIAEVRCGITKENLNLQNAYKNPIWLSSSSINKPLYVYPFSEDQVPHQLAETFANIVDIFLQNIEQDKKARLALRSFDCKLLMCGPNPENAQAAIVVFCDSTALTAIEAIITQKHVLQQCSVRAPPSRSGSKLKAWNRLARSLNGDSKDAKFNLYFCGLEQAYSTPCSASTASTDSLISIESGCGSEIFNCCGSSLRDTSARKISTMTCAVRIEGEVYGLTTAHGFREQSICVTERMGHHSQKDDQEAKHIGNADKLYCEPMLPTCSIRDRDLADLDWSLLRLQRPLLIRHVLKSKQTTLVAAQPSVLEVQPYLSTIRYERTRVILVTSTGAKRGQLLGSISFRIDPSTMSRIGTWSVELNEPGAIGPGDSGTCVIDETSHRVFGYVTSVDIFGLVQVMPLAAVLDQIKMVFTPTSINLSRHLGQLDSGIIDRISRYNLWQRAFEVARLRPPESDESNETSDLEDVNDSPHYSEINKCHYAQCDWLAAFEDRARLNQHLLTEHKVDYAALDSRPRVSLQDIEASNSRRTHSDEEAYSCKLWEQREFEHAVRRRRKHQAISRRWDLGC